MYYKLIIQKTNGERVQLGRQDKNVKVIELRRNSFLTAKKKGLRPFYTMHTEIIRVMPKKRKKVARYPKGTTATATTKTYYRRYNGVVHKIKPHKINLGGKIKPKK